MFKNSAKIKKSTPKQNPSPRPIQIETQVTISLLVNASQVIHSLLEGSRLSSPLDKQRLFTSINTKLLVAASPDQERRGGYFPQTPHLWSGPEPCVRDGCRSAGCRQILYLLSNTVAHSCKMLNRTPIPIG